MIVSCSMQALATLCTTAYSYNDALLAAHLHFFLSLVQNFLNINSSTLCTQGEVSLFCKVRWSVLLARCLFVHRLQRDAECVD